MLTASPIRSNKASLLRARTFRPRAIRTRTAASNIRSRALVSEQVAGTIRLARQRTVNTGQ